MTDPRYHIEPIREGQTHQEVLEICISKALVKLKNDNAEMGMNLKIHAVYLTAVGDCIAAVEFTGLVNFEASKRAYHTCLNEDDMHELYFNQNSKILSMVTTQVICGNWLIKQET